MRVDISDAARWNRRVVFLRRVVAVTFELPPWVTEEYTKTAAISETVFRNGSWRPRVVIEPRPLGEATELHCAGKRRVHLIPPDVGRPHHGVTGRATAEKVAKIGRKLKTGL